MKISISNIAWSAEHDNEMYDFCEKSALNGLEIAPTRIFPDQPYRRVKEAAEFRKSLYEKFHLEISSLQSIWFGRKENIFNSVEERNSLIEYTKSAFEFAHKLNCKNLVFGCPKNRNRNYSGDDIKIAVEFFSRLGQIAQREDTVLSLEANPVIYNTNFMNTTKETYNIIKETCHKAIKMNYDLGTVIFNNEDIEEIGQLIDEINHVHISEPYLEKVNIGETQKKLIKILKNCGYKKYVSMEMKNMGNIEIVKRIILQFLEIARS